MSDVGRHQSGLEFLLEYIRTDGEELGSDVLRTVAGLYGAIKQDVLRSLALVAAHNLVPDSAHQTFQAAYALSNLGLNEAALVLYERAINIDKKNPWALNNLGVLLHDMKCPSLGMERYQSAGEAGNTLAIANRSSRLIKVGALDEAELLLMEAMKHDLPDESVARRLVEISEIRAKETESHEAASVTGRSVLEFLSRAADALLRPTQPPPLAQYQWTRPNGDTVELLVEDGATFIECNGSDKWRARLSGDGSARCVKYEEYTWNFHKAGSPKEWQLKSDAILVFEPSGGIAMLVLQNSRVETLLPSNTRPAAEGNDA